MLKINLLEKQWPKHVRELDAALKEFQEEYNRVMKMYVKQPEYFMMTPDERLFARCIDPNADGCPNPNSSAPSIKE